MAKVTVTLQRFRLDGLPMPNEEALSYLHGKQLTVAVLPRPGDFIKDSDLGSGYVEVARVIYDLKGGITLVIK